MPGVSGGSAAVTDHDADIRRLVLPALELARDAAPGSVLIEELDLGWGNNARIDVALVSPKYMHGYEIKARKDTLARLPKQALIYSAVFDLMTIITVPEHVAGVEALVPTWWTMAVADGTRVRLHRQGTENPGPSAAQRGERLWLDKIRKLVKAKGADHGLKRAAKRAWCARLGEVCTAAEVGAALRTHLIEGYPEMVAARKRSKGFRDWARADEAARLKARSGAGT